MKWYQCFSGTQLGNQIKKIAFFNKKNCSIKQCYSSHCICCIFHGNKYETSFLEHQSEIQKSQTWRNIFMNVVGKQSAPKFNLFKQITFCPEWNIVQDLLMILFSLFAIFWPESSLQLSKNIISYHKSMSVWFTVVIWCLRVYERCASGMSAWLPFWMTSMSII